MTPFAGGRSNWTFPIVNFKNTGLLALALGSSLLIEGRAADFAPEQVEFFETKIRPLLAERCYDCHAGIEAKSGLRLDSRATILKGSDYRKVVDLAKPAESPLILAVKHAGAAQKISNMPKEGDKLSDDPNRRPRDNGSCHGPAVAGTERESLTGSERSRGKTALGVPGRSPSRNMPADVPRATRSTYFVRRKTG